MRVCPQCRSTFPSHYAKCPQDGSDLEKSAQFGPGTIIRNKYEIQAILGQGGMGTVYKARHVDFDEVYALKFVSEHLTADTNFLERFRSEAVIMRKLDHPNAVRVFDLDRTEDNLPFFVMEYVQGRSLRRELQEHGALPVTRALSIAASVCGALSAAHSMGIIHRDIKPENIMLQPNPDGEPVVKVMDFGVAKIRSHTTQLGGAGGASTTQTGMLVGTPAYMSPEQAEGRPGDRLDGRSDIYSAGVVLFEMLTGRQPFEADTPLGVLMHHVRTSPPSPRELSGTATIPEPVADLVMKTLAKDPATRFATAGEMEQAIRTLLTGGVGSDATLAYGTPVPDSEEAPGRPLDSVEPPAEPVPSAAASAAEPEPWTELIFRGSIWRAFTDTFKWGTVLVILALVAGGLSSMWEIGKPWLIFVLLGTVGLACLGIFLYLATSRLVINNQGIADTTMFVWKRMAWNDVQCFYYAFQQRSYFDSVPSYLPRYTLVAQDKQQIKIGHRFTDLAGIGKQLIQRTYPPLLRQYEDRLNQEEDLDFAAIRVHPRSGLSIVKGRVWIDIAWDDVGDYQIADRFFFIRRRRERKPLSAPLGKVANAYVLMTILDRILGRRTE